MKNYAKPSLQGLLLVSTVFATNLVFADADTVSAINALTGVVQQQNSNANADVSRRQLGIALINYQAAQAMSAYQLNQELMFMPAPGSDWAVTAGNVIGGAAANVAPQIFASSFLHGLAVFTVAPKITYQGVEIDTTPIQTTGPVDFYNTMAEFITTGNTGALKWIDISPMIQGYRVSADQAKVLINMATNPFPVTDSSIIEKIKSNSVNPQQKDAFGSRIASEAAIAISTGALTDIASRRIPPPPPASTGGTPPPPPKTEAEIINEYGKQRFSTSDWYNAMSVASEAAMIREQTEIDAFMAYMATKNFHIAEQQLALLASMNVVLSRLNVAMNELGKQMAAAQAASAAAQASLPTVTPTSQ